MTKREYLKYNNPEAFDKQGKHVKPGDTVVFNNHYGASPYIGVADHYTQSGNLAIHFEYKYNWNGGSRTCMCWAYRHPNTVVKIKSGRKKK